MTSWDGKKVKMQKETRLNFEHFGSDHIFPYIYDWLRDAQATSKASDYRHKPVKSLDYKHLTLFTENRNANKLQTPSTMAVE